MRTPVQTRARGSRWLGVASAPMRTERRPAQEPLRARDLELLRWLAEQYGARIDQLEVLLVCGPRTVQRSLARLRAAGLIETRRLLVGEPAWAIPTSAGLRTTGHGFGLWHPRVGLLAHVATVNDVRLHITPPLARERMGMRAQPRSRAAARRAPARRCGHHRGATRGDRGRAEREVPATNAGDPR